MKKLGRNDLCHCGSGNKYKRCCLEKDQRTIQGKVIPFPGTRAASVPQQKADQLRQMIHDKLDWMDWNADEHRELAESLFPQICRDYELKSEEQLFQVFSLLIVWNNFSREANPKYRKPGGYASALEYIATSLLNISVTKSDIAKKHEVAVATLTRNSGQIQDFMDGIAASGDQLDSEDAEESHEDQDLSVGR
ncbi:MULTISPECIES: SEC-C metal-binding domain-containing protein [Paenibacillus]|jgi:hypothetical protein|uniref:SEC-C motif domain protein n=2 Tax=Paenibacillus lactis TaxID=228574 RepID=G4HJ87_9BACL|nr:SEC-C metal-binding domain-containing protein [Paenibacillus lactis]EHB62805.1 SEC-C motif domain protein [Paenibacillus lactis 154]MBP1895512.1 hypothetical protein [Paenibacillus lactis]MCM3494826.1 SEC-C metal-binding domain-containing protein [Paenibacillus lactis]GIO91300.1 hypothetical protein J31TS3_25270 [Paenibacillus lactis]HAF98828.1 zinc chelation protein SecC [Paenibacillus lactis]